MSTSGTLCQFPFVAEEIVEIAVAPLRRRACPSHFEATGDRVIAMASAIAVFPALALLFNTSACGLRSDVLVGVGCTVSFTKSMPTRDEGNRLFVVHRHTGKSFPNIVRSRDGIWVSVGAFRIDVDQTHLHRSEWIL